MILNFFYYCKTVVVVVVTVLLFPLEEFPGRYKIISLCV